MNNNELPKEGLISLKEVLSVIHVSRVTLYRWWRNDMFPKPVKLGDRILWDVSKVREFIANPSKNGDADNA